MNSNPWISASNRKQYRWQGNCPEHGQWFNDYKDGCVHEQYEQERYTPKPKQLKLWQKTP